MAASCNQNQAPLSYDQPVAQPESGRLTLLASEVNLPLDEQYLRLATEATAAGVKVVFEPPIIARRPDELRALTSQAQYIGFEHFLAHTTTDPRFHQQSTITTRAFNNCIFRPGTNRSQGTPDPLAGLVVATRMAAGLLPLPRELGYAPGNMLSAKCRQYAINIGSFIIAFQSGTKIPLGNRDTSQFYLRCLADRLAKHFDSPDKHFTNSNIT